MRNNDVSSAFYSNTCDTMQMLHIKLLPKYSNTWYETNNVTGFVQVIQRVSNKQYAIHHGNVTDLRKYKYYRV